MTCTNAVNGLFGCLASAFRRCHPSWNPQLSVALLAILFFLIAPSALQAADITEKNNQTDVEAKIERGWSDAASGSVVWGERIGYNDYADAALAVIESIRDRDFEPLKNFLGDKADQMAVEINRHAEEFDEELVRDLLLRALMTNGTTIQEGRLEISAGLAPVKYWKEATATVPEFRECKWRAPDEVTRYLPGNWGRFETDGICISAGRQSIKADMPPKFLPYLRYRLKGFPELDGAELAAKAWNILEADGLVGGADGVPAPSEIDTILVRELESALARLLPQIPSNAVQGVVRDLSLPAFRVNRAAIQQTTSPAELEQVMTKIAIEARERLIEQISSYPGSLVFDWAKSNRSEKRREVAEDGWQVVWGVNVDEIEYVELTAAVAGAAVSGGGTLALYFTEYLERTLAAVERQLPNLDRSAVLKSLAQALEMAIQGRPGHIRLGGLEIEAGLASYNRWLEFDYPAIAKWPPPKCEWVEIPGTDIKLEGFCVRIDMQTFKSNLPNHHQPYIKLRYTDGSAPQPKGNRPPPTDRVYVPRSQTESSWQPPAEQNGCAAIPSASMTLSGESPDSWEAALNGALEQAIVPLRGVQVGQVIDQAFLLRDGAVSTYRITIEVDVEQTDCFPNVVKNWQPPSYIVSLATHLDYYYNDIQYTGCTLDSRGIVECFGIKDLEFPKDLRAKQIAVEAQDRFCAIDLDDRVRCFGDYDYNPGVDVRKRTLDPIFAKSISAGEVHTCVIQMDDSVYCWGFDSFGGSSPPADLRAKRLVMGGYLSCAITLDDHVRCWGGHSHANILSSFDRVVVDLAVDDSLGACEIYADHSVSCWSFDENTGLTNGFVPAGLKAKQLILPGIDNQTACAIKLDDSVQCWERSCEEVEEEFNQQCSDYRPLIPRDFRARMFSHSYGSFCVLDREGQIHCVSQGVPGHGPLTGSLLPIEEARRLAEGN